MGYVRNSCWKEIAVTLEEETKRGLHGNHCKVIEKRKDCDDNAESGICEDGVREDGED